MLSCAMVDGVMNWMVRDVVRGDWDLGVVGVNVGVNFEMGAVRSKLNAKEKGVSALRRGWSLQMLDVDVWK
jgi:hypothetical protein